MCVSTAQLFFIKHIVSEATSIVKDLEDQLSKFENHIASCDGWLSKGHAEIYPVNITTASPRQSYLVEGLQLTRKSTNAEILFSGIEAVNLFTSWFMLLEHDRSFYISWLSIPQLLSLTQPEMLRSAVWWSAKKGPGFLTAWTHIINSTWWRSTSCWISRNSQRLQLFSSKSFDALQVAWIGVTIIRMY